MAMRPTPVNAPAAAFLPGFTARRGALCRTVPAAYKPAMNNRQRSRSPTRGGRPSAAQKPGDRRGERYFVYGLHAVAAALSNPRRSVLRLLATENAVHRLAELGAMPSVTVESAFPKDLDRLLGAEAVHQGVAAEVEPLPSADLDEIVDTARLILVLDQVTDPHNVGAVLRSAAAMAADAVIVTARHSPAETGVLAKSASGALDLVPLVVVPNLARALTELGHAGVFRIGLDSDGETDLEEAFGPERIALVLGAEGKGLRHLTRETCDLVARLALPGVLRSLNVSNAAALALYLARRSLPAARG
jgi:23S rRNA (guanosine2251-2'-O)-methyltransferase